MGIGQLDTGLYRVSAKRVTLPRDLWMDRRMHHLLLESHL